MDERALLLRFCGFIGLEPRDGSSTRLFREGTVDRFLSRRRGALGFSEDELKGAARDRPAHGAPTREQTHAEDQGGGSEV